MLEHSRNFAHPAGGERRDRACAGDCVMVMDGDLDPPEVIPDLIAKWREGYQVVFAERRSRNGRGAGSREFRISIRCSG